MSKPRLRALIFDVDGTLAETEEVHRRAFNEAFAEAQLDWRWSQTLYAKLLEVTGGKERIRHFIDAYEASPTLDDAAIAALHKDKTARYTRFVEQGIVHLRPNIDTLLREAETSGIRLAVATTTSRPNVEALLSAVLQRNPFEVIAAGDDVKAKKPAPDVYQLALERLGLPAESCVALEDTVNGLRSALGAGIACIVTPSVYSGNGPFDGALRVVDLDSERLSLPEIAAWFEAAKVAV